MVVGSAGVVNQIEIDLSGTTSSIGSGSQNEIFSLSDGANGGGVSRTILEGAVTYDFTPLLGSAPPKPPPAPGAIPEPSTWAMMLVGFAGLGYAALRRKGA
jgi:PEP-CTERM motif